MQRHRAAVYATVTVIVGVTLLTGPVVGVVDLTAERFDATGLGDGNATVDRVDAPERARLTQAFQSEDYTLEVPDARVHLESVSGRPLLQYQIQIPAFGFIGTETVFLDGTDEGWLTVAMTSNIISGSEVTRSEYNATLSVSVRANGNETVVYREPVTVEVTS